MNARAMTDALQEWVTKKLLSTLFMKRLLLGGLSDKLQKRLMNDFVNQSAQDQIEHMFMTNSELETIIPKKREREQLKESIQNAIKAYLPRLKDERVTVFLYEYRDERAAKYVASLAVSMFKAYQNQAKTWLDKVANISTDDREASNKYWNQLIISSQQKIGRIEDAVVKTYHFLPHLAILFAVFSMIWLVSYEIPESLSGSKINPRDMATTTRIGRGTMLIGVLFAYLTIIRFTPPQLSPDLNREQKQISDLISTAMNIYFKKCDESKALSRVMMSAEVGSAHTPASTVMQSAELGEGKEESPSSPPKVKVKTRNPASPPPQGAAASKGPKKVPSIPFGENNYFFLKYNKSKIDSIIPAERKILRKKCYGAVFSQRVLDRYSKNQTGLKPCFFLQKGHLYYYKLKVIGEDAFILLNHKIADGKCQLKIADVAYNAHKKLRRQ